MIDSITSLTRSSYNVSKFEFRNIQTFTLKSCSKISPENNEMLMMMLMAVRIIPRYKHFFAFCGSSLLIAKYAMIAPINPKKIGQRYHQRERILSGYICNY